MQRNMHNKALENNCNLQCFWLSLMRSYPSLYEQQAYNFDLTRVNSQLIAYFQAESKDLLEDDPIVFLQILEEYFITELYDISPHQIIELLTNTLNNEEPGSERRLRISMAAVSLYTSYSLLRSPLPRTSSPTQHSPNFSSESNSTYKIAFRHKPTPSERLSFSYSVKGCSSKGQHKCTGPFRNGREEMWVVGC